MDSLTGITPLRFWLLRRSFGVQVGTTEQEVRSKLGLPAKKERLDDGSEWWKYPVYCARHYDISYSIQMNAGVVTTSVWGSSLRRSAGEG
jgi:hypothetical protein